MALVNNHMTEYLHAEFLTVPIRAHAPIPE